MPLMAYRVAPGSRSLRIHNVDTCTCMARPQQDNRKSHSFSVICGYLFLLLGYKNNGENRKEKENS